MFAIWWRSETFSHGFFIFPISGWLIWRKRAQLAESRANTDFRALILLAFIGIAWMLADLADVLVAKQLAIIGAIPTITWLLFGWNRIRVIAFPLAFLFFAVPIGEGLIQPMMQFTAAFTVQALKLSGVPVYWEGLLLSLPSGNWSIVEGCSGVRYLIASTTLGCLYAYLTYQTPWRRVLFVAAAIAVPIVGNGLRAYLIIMVAHLSDMRLAVGVDHILYGWVFFGVLMLGLFWLGSFWRERDQDKGESGPRFDGSLVIDISPTALPERPVVLATGLIAGLLILAITSAWAAHHEDASKLPASINLLPPLDTPAWVTDERFTDWSPRYIGSTAEFQGAYHTKSDRVGVYLAFYATQRQGSEVVNSQNVMVEQKHPVWTQIYLRKVPAHIRGQKSSVYESELVSRGEKLLAWHWYWIAGQHLSNPFEAKLREAFVKLFGADNSGAGIVIFTRRGAELAKSRAVLQRFIDDMLPNIEATLADAKEQVISVAPDATEPDNS